jgi:hypothetical protein
MRALLLAAVIVGEGGYAQAQKKTAEAAGGAASEPPPGACSYIVQSVKVCATIQRAGAFDVFAHPAAPVHITFENDKVVQPSSTPDALYYQFDWNAQEIVIRAKRKDVPPKMPIVIRSSTMTVTLNLRPGSPEKADTQVTIRDPNRAEHEAEIKRAVAEAEKRLEPKAQERVEAILLGELAQSSAEVKHPRGTAHARNAYPDGLVVVHARDVVRIGSRRFLVFSIQNTGSDNFDVRGVRLYAEGRELPSTFQLAPPADSSRISTAPSTIFPREERGGAIVLPPAASAGVQRTKLVVEETNPKRNIELSGLEVP